MCPSWERQESSSQGQDCCTHQWKAVEYLMCMVNISRKGSPDDIWQHNTLQNRAQARCSHNTWVFRLTHFACTLSFLLQWHCIPCSHLLMFSLWTHIHITWAFISVIAHFITHSCTPCLCRSDTKFYVLSFFFLYGSWDLMFDLFFTSWYEAPFLITSEKNYTLY